MATPGELVEPRYSPRPSPGRGLVITTSKYLIPWQPQPLCSEEPSAGDELVVHKPRFVVSRPQVASLELEDARRKYGAVIETARQFAFRNLIGILRRPLAV